MYIFVVGIEAGADIGAMFKCARLIMTFLRSTSMCSRSFSRAVSMRPMISSFSSTREMIDSILLT